MTQQCLYSGGDGHRSSCFFILLPGPWYSSSPLYNWATIGLQTLEESLEESSAFDWGISYLNGPQCLVEFPREPSRGPAVFTAVVNNAAEEHPTCQNYVDDVTQ